ncbi:MAG: maleylacetoacetate isomerase [Myxococcota bacterium]|nr:maleylacetoacetate isomerase [Myxococcota bacterium]
MILHGYWRSSSAYRVRIALHHKGLAFENHPVNLLTGEHKSPEHLARNPLGAVPVLELDDGTMLSQSMAILEYLEATCPEPALIPQDPILAAQARMFAEHVNASIQPLQNLGLVRYVGTRHGADKVEWMKHWIEEGLGALEILAQSLERQSPWLVADRPSIAEVLLVPQLYNARRWGCDIDAWPTLLAAEAAALALPAFAAAHPDQQPDAVS